MSEQTETREKAVPGTGHQAQTFLIGDEVYIRTFVSDDAKNATSWRNSIFPKSTEMVKKWIEEQVPKDGKKMRQHLAIVRKDNDVVVGSMTVERSNTATRLSAYVDVLYGEPGDRWLGEAIAITADWLVNEQFSPNMHVGLPADRDVTVSYLKERGFVETARWREMIERNGKRIDRIVLAYLNQAWKERLGDPMAMELPRSGSGEARPVPARVTLDGDPPKQAVMIGERVYLRPQDKTDARKEAEAMRKEEETFFDIGRHLTSEAQWQSFISSDATEDYPSNVWFAVCLRENDEVVGSVGLIDLDMVNRCAETGSGFMGTENRGKGYGFEAKHLLLEYAFETLGLHMVNSFVYYPNTRSAAALRKQGYKEAGPVVWLYPYEGGFGNMITFDLLADEWRALPRG